MLTSTIQMSVTSLFSGVVTTAMEEIRAEKLDRIYCTQTGSLVGWIAQEEVERTLHLELERHPLADSTSLVQTWTLHHAVTCSRVAPSMNVFKDTHQVSRFMNQGREGRARLFSYLAGRLVYTAVTPERHHNSLNFMSGILYYRIQLLDRLNALPENWAKSLTASDESASIAMAANQILAESAFIPATPIEEGKAAQHCLEALLRLDAIHNLRAAIYSPEIISEIEGLREFESRRGYFTHMWNLLQRIESDAIIQSRKQHMRKEPNRFIVQAAIAAVNEAGIRLIEMQDALSLMRDVDAKSHLGRGREELRQLRGLMQEDPSNEVLTQVSKQLELLRLSMFRETHSERSIANGKSNAARNFNEGNSIVRHGISAMRSTIRAAKDAGRVVDPVLVAKLAAAEKAIGVKPRTVSATKRRKPMSAERQALHNRFNSMMGKGFTFAPTEDK